ncbi:thiamine biosynthesis protein ThiS [Chlorobium limicola DSM 245]|uniref:Thiamine biosynthesis protein ThiS n=1 Tax=Chlorobium limicola (strain DSM 245 / NBRC 103803 / 6330) TaxID=290315 RepID=B3EH69_CHLL2|nr:sulfur carrier protein ThiS [Chlorobium limicola]ACD89749.1 thiamine biosynthesis protein ThiS [Chlorobium limicola DSM 245]
MSQMITIQVNGESFTLPAGSSVSNLLATIGSNQESVATVVNDQIIRPDNRASFRLKEGDRVEILIFAGGG